MRRLLPTPQEFAALLVLWALCALVAGTSFPAAALQTAMGY